MQLQPFLRRWILALYALCFAGMAFAGNSIITSKFTPSQSDINRSAYYKITIKGGDLTTPIQLPHIPGIEFISQGDQHYLSSINGSMTRQTVFIYRVVAEEPGEYTMPAFEVELSDGKATVPAASISFIKGVPKDNEEHKPIGLELKLPKENFYVGETVPCQLRLFVEAGVRASLVSSEPTQESDAFILSQAQDSPQRALSNKNGIQYQEILWNYTITPIKAGDYPLQFEYIIEAALPSQDDPNPFNASPLGSSLLHAMFNARRFRLETGKDTVTVASLPTEGRPENFTGAIGEFTVRQKLSTHTAEVGEPITLTLSISGKGNFDRIQAPPIEAQGMWKVYEPKRSFTPTDSLGYKGIETIEYVLIPQSQAIQATPRIEFSYFDPRDAVYRRAVADPVPVTITLPEQKMEAIKRAASMPSTTPENTATEALQTSEPPKPGLIEIETEVGGGSHSLKPAFFHMLFWIIQALIAASLLTWYIVRSRALKLSQDTAYAHRVFAKKAVKKQLLLAEAAVSKGDALTFFAEAQRTVQAALSKTIGKKANALTWAEIETFLRGKHAPEDCLHEARLIFENTEALRFGGQTMATGELSEWLTRLIKLIESLDKLS